MWQASLRDILMVSLTLPPYFLDEGVEPEESTIADGFVEVLARLELECDLPADVWSVAEDVLQALKTRMRNIPAENATLQ